MYPDSGSIEMKGRVSSLIELGAGFHPDMSGRQNIYTNASIFGLTRKEIDDRLNAIIVFSELEEFIDNPVRTYSSGMYMRLAFSVAINVDADILLIDEILAVGDVNFQAKCFRKLRDIKEKGTTIVIVSHALEQIEAICERSIWIEKGVIRSEGDPRKVHRDYLQYMGIQRHDCDDGKDHKEIEDPANSCPEDSDPAGVVREGNHKIVFKNIRIVNAKGEESRQFERGDDMIIEADYKVNCPVTKGYFAIDIIREEDNLYCFATNTNFSQNETVPFIHDGKMSVRLKNVPLMPQRYFVDMILKELNTEPIDIVRHAVDFEMFSYVKGGGVAYIENEWKWAENSNEKI
jgi:ABC-2 type transport system ATP-binding protein